MYIHPQSTGVQSVSVIVLGGRNVIWKATVHSGKKKTQDLLNDCLSIEDLDSSGDLSTYYDSYLFLRTIWETQWFQPKGY